MSQIAVHAEGEMDETPFTFASSIPGLVFHWSVTNMDVHSLVSVYDRVSQYDDTVAFLVFFNCFIRQGYPYKRSKILQHGCVPGILGKAL